jgi:hypothetical protein
VKGRSRARERKKEMYKEEEGEILWVPQKQSSIYENSPHVCLRQINLIGGQYCAIVVLPDWSGRHAFY